VVPSGDVIASLCIPAKNGRGGVISDEGSQRSVGSGAQWSCQLNDFSLDHPEEDCFATIDAAPADKIATLSITDNGAPCACRTTTQAHGDHIQAAKKVRFV
jgi:hypothetical protein